VARMENIRRRQETRESCDHARRYGRSLGSHGTVASDLIAMAWGNDPRCPQRHSGSSVIARSPGVCRVTGGCPFFFREPKLLDRVALRRRPKVVRRRRNEGGCLFAEERATAPRRKGVPFSRALSPNPSIVSALSGLALGRARFVTRRRPKPARLLPPSRVLSWLASRRARFPNGSVGCSPSFSLAGVRGARFVTGPSARVTSIVRGLKRAVSCLRAFNELGRPPALLSSKGNAPVARTAPSQRHSPGQPAYPGAASRPSDRSIVANLPSRTAGGACVTVGETNRPGEVWPKLVRIWR